MQPKYRIIKRRPTTREYFGSQILWQNRERYWIQKACSCLFLKNPMWKRVEVKNGYASSFETMEEAEQAIKNLLIEPSGVNVVAVYGVDGKIG